MVDSTNFNSDENAMPASSEDPMPENNTYNPPADDPPYEDTSQRTPEEAEWENNG